MPERLWERRSNGGGCGVAAATDARLICGGPSGGGPGTIVGLATFYFGVATMTGSGWAIIGAGGGGVEGGGRGWAFELAGCSTIIGAGGGGVEVNAETRQ